MSLLKRGKKPPGEEPVDIFAQNIQSIAELVARREARLSRSQRVIESITQSIGRPRFLYANLLAMGLWILFNSGLFGPPLDPAPFFWMATVLCMESVLVAGMVLITQNRQGQEADRRSQLDLQINLLSEQKISKILAVLEELSRAQNLVHQHDPEVKAMQESADPEILLTALEFAMDQAAQDVSVPVAELAPDQKREIQDVEGALEAAHREVTAAREAVEE